MNVVFTLSADLDTRHYATANDVSYALEELVDAIARRCIDLPHITGTVRVDVT